MPPDFETAKQVATAKTRSAAEKRARFDNCNQAANSASAALQQEQVDESNLAGMIEMARNAQKHAAGSLESARSQRADSMIASELARAEEDARASSARSCSRASRSDSNWG